MDNPSYKIGDIYDKQFENLSFDELEQNIDAVSTNVTEGEYTKILSNEEIAVAKSDFADISLRLNKINQEKAEVLEEFKQRLKEPKAQAAELLEQIKTKVVIKEGKIFHVPNFENNTMYLFDSMARCVDFRPLVASERQLAINTSGVRKLSNS